MNHLYQVRSVGEASRKGLVVTRMDSIHPLDYPNIYMSVSYPKRLKKVRKTYGIQAYPSFIHVENIGVYRFVLNSS